MARALQVEALRCATARGSWRLVALLGRTVTRIAPRFHPWRTLAASAIEDFSELTSATLVGRDAAGVPKVKVTTSRKRATHVVYATLSLFLAYSFVGDFVTDVPELSWRLF